MPTNLIGCAQEGAPCRRDRKWYLVVRDELQTAIAAWLPDARTCLLLVHEDIRMLDAAARAIASSNGWHSVSIGGELSAALLQVSARRRPRTAQDWLTSRLVSLAPGPALCTEVDLLFEPTLELDPLWLFQRVGRVVPTAALWPGSYANDILTYATATHTHYRSWLRPGATVTVLS